MTDRPNPRPRPRAASVAAQQGRAVVALERERLRQASGGRAGALLGLFTALGLGVLLVLSRLTRGGDASPLPLLVTAAETLAWLGGGPVALAAANDRRAADATDGIEALAASRGIAAPALESARVVAAMVQVTRAVGLPLFALGLAAVTLSRSLSAAWESAAALVALALFALATGVTAGGLGALSGRLGAGRGRWLLAALVLGPWVLGDLAGHAGWSLPGALDALLTFALRLAVGDSWP